MEPTDNTNYPINTEPQVQYVVKKELVPGAILVLIMGIISLSSMAFFGWIPALVALNHYKRGMTANDENPGRYSETSVNMAKSGKKMADIGLILGILGMFATGLYYYFIFSTLGTHFH